MQKKRNNSCTLCGTPQYLAPEVIQNYPHGFTVDWYTLGVLIYEMIYGTPPFSTDEDSKMYEKILKSQVKFKRINGKDINKNTKDIIISLLRKIPHKRLGAGTNGSQKVKHHPFFRKLKWSDMFKQKIQPPYIPNLKNEKDISKFEYFPDATPNEKLIDDPTGKLFKWVNEF